MDVHQLAVEISNDLNQTQANDGLAERLISFAQRAPDMGNFLKTASVFGKFSPAFLKDKYVQIKDSSASQGMKVVDSDQMPPPSSLPSRSSGSLAQSAHQHTFKPKTPRTNQLVDRPGLQKRKEMLSAEATDSSSSKKPRVEEEEFKMPSRPGPAPQNARQRAQETPSHGGGLSDKAKQRLEEHRRAKAQKKGKLYHWELYVYEC